MTLALTHWFTVDTRPGFCTSPLTHELPCDSKGLKKRCLGGWPGLVKLLRSTVLLSSLAGLKEDDNCFEPVIGYG
jgi:hypothetical protein